VINTLLLFCTDIISYELYDYCKAKSSETVADLSEKQRSVSAVLCVLYSVSNYRKLIHIAYNYKHICPRIIY